MRLGRAALGIAAVTLVAAAVLILATMRGTKSDDAPGQPLKNESPLLPASRLQSWLDQQNDYVEVPVARYDQRDYRLGADTDALKVRVRDSTSVGTVSYGMQCPQKSPCFYLVIGRWREGELEVMKLVRTLTPEEAAQIKAARYAKSP